MIAKIEGKKLDKGEVSKASTIITIIITINKILYFPPSCYFPLAWLVLSFPSVVLVISLFMYFCSFSPHRHHLLLPFSFSTRWRKKVVVPSWFTINYYHSLLHCTYTEFFLSSPFPFLSSQVWLITYCITSCCFTSRASVSTSSFPLQFHFLPLFLHLPFFLGSLHT